MQITLASANKKKVMELQRILSKSGVSVRPVSDCCPGFDVVEDTETFAGNAIKKAVAAARVCKGFALADDSGLEVFALGGRPSVRSARYAGPDKDDTANIMKVLGELKGVADRQARFVCVIAFASMDGLIGFAKADVMGRITDRPIGKEGFGYDPIFMPRGYNKTFAQMPAEAKDRLSHRAKALDIFVRRILPMVL